MLITGVFVEGFFALIEAVIAMIQLVGEALGFSVSHLASEPASNESRFSGRRLLVAFVPLLLVIGLIVGIFWFASWRADVRAARVDETREVVRESTNSLAKQIDDDGRFVRHAGAQLDVEDAWGEPLRVRYEPTLLGESVTVWSTGPDEEDQTWDDISAKESVVLPKQAGRALLDRLGNAIRDHGDGDGDKE